MKKISYFKMMGIVSLCILGGCGVKEKTKDVSSTQGISQDSKIKNTDTKSLIMEKDGVTSEVVLKTQDDALIQETVTIYTPFSSINVSNDEEAEAFVKNNMSNNKMQGVKVSTEIKNEEIIYTMETDYKKVELSELGIDDSMLAKNGKLPSWKVRTQDYVSMGYKEK